MATRRPPPRPEPDEGKRKVVIFRDRCGECLRLGLGFVAHIVRGSQAEGVVGAGLGLLVGVAPAACRRELRPRALALLLHFQAARCQAGSGIGSTPGHANRYAVGGGG